MGTRKIDIDDEVYVFLQGHARPLEDSANDVLRRLLLEPEGVHPGSPETASLSDSVRRRPGDLRPFIDLGLLQAGDELVHEQPRKGTVHRATVTDDGWLRTKDQDFSKVSPALKACVGHEINGWGNWSHSASSRLLQELREELRRRQNGSS